MTPSAPVTGKAYFIERLLKDVIFQEAGLAGVNRRLQLQKLALHSAAYVACGAVLFLGMIALIVSYTANANYIDDVSRTAADLESTELGVGTAGLPLEAFLPRLDSLRTVTDAAREVQERCAMADAHGVVPRQIVGSAARDAYAREDDGVLPPLSCSTIRAGAAIQCRGTSRSFTNS